MKLKKLLVLTCAATLLVGCGSKESEKEDRHESRVERDKEDKEEKEEVEEDTEVEDETEEDSADESNDDIYYIGGIPVLSEDDDPHGLKLYFQYEGYRYDDEIQVDTLTIVNRNNRDTIELNSYLFPKNDCTRIVTDDNREYLYLEVDSMNDYYKLVVCDISHGNAKFVDDTWFTYLYIDPLDCSSPDFTDPNNMIIGDLHQALGTFYYYNTYHVGADGTPEPNSEAYTIYDTCCSEEITSLKALNLEVVDADGNLTGSVTTVPAGTVYEPISTDTESWIDCKISDGTIVRLRIDNYGYDGTINGTLVRDLFSGLMYVG